MIPCKLPIALQLAWSNDLVLMELLLTFLFIVVGDPFIIFLALDFDLVSFEEEDYYLLVKDRPDYNDILEAFFLCPRSDKDPP